MTGFENPQAQVTANENSAVPDCANENTLPNYVGLDYDAPRVRPDLLYHPELSRLLSVRQFVCNIS